RYRVVILGAQSHDSYKTGEGPRDKLHVHKMCCQHMNIKNTLVAPHNQLAIDGKKLAIDKKQYLCIAWTLDRKTDEQIRAMSRADCYRDFCCAHMDTQDQRKTLYDTFKSFSPEVQDDISMKVLGCQ